MTRITRWFVLMLFAALIVGANLPIAAAPAAMHDPMQAPGVVVFNRVADLQELATYQASLSGGCVPDYAMVRGARPCVICNHIDNLGDLAAYQASLQGGRPTPRIVMLPVGAF